MPKDKHGTDSERRSDGRFRRIKGHLRLFPAKQVSGTFILTVLNSAASFILSIILARLLGVEDYGRYAYAMSWITVLGMMAKLGLGDIVTRESVKYRANSSWEELHGIMLFSLLATASVGALLLLIASGLAWWLLDDSPMDRDVLVLAFLSLPLTAAIAPALAAIKGMGKIVWSQVPNLLFQPLLFLLLLALGWVFLEKAFSILLVFALYIFSMLGALVVAFILLKRRLVEVGYPAQNPAPIYHARSWFFGGLPLMFVAGMYILNANVDILMLGSIVGPEAAAVYKASARGAALVALSSAIVGVPLAPLIAKLYHENRGPDMQQAITNSVRLAFLAGVGVGVPLVLWGEDFLLLFGEDFRVGSTALSILVLAQLFNAFGGPAEVGLAMMGHEKLAAFALGISTIVNLVLNAILIPAFGMVGAASATACSIVVMKGLLVFFVFHSERIDFTAVGFRSKISMHKVDRGS